LTTRGILVGLDRFRTTVVHLSELSMRAKSAYLQPIDTFWMFNEQPKSGVTRVLKRLSRQYPPSLEG